MTEQHPIIEGAMSQGRMRQEVSLVVQQELEIAGITEASFSALKEEAEAVAAIEVTDEDTLAQVQRVITKCVRMRSTIKGAIEPGKKWAHQLHRAYTSNESEFTSTVDAIEAPLKAKKMAFLAEVDRKRKEAEEAEQRRQQERRAFAMWCGFAPDLHEWVNGTTRITDNQLITQDAEAWANLERSMLAIKEEAEAKKRAEEEEREKLRQAQADLERRQKELEERERKMREAVNEARKNELLALGLEVVYETDEQVTFVAKNQPGIFRFLPHSFDKDFYKLSDGLWLSTLDRMMAYVRECDTVRQEAQEREAREALIADRVKRLKEAGWEEAGVSFLALRKESDDFTVVPQPLDSIADLSEEEIDTRVSMGKAELARREAARQEVFRQEAEATARKRLQEEAAQKEQQERERVARMGDAEKWEEFVEAIASAAPKMSSSIGQHAVKYVIDTVDKITPGVLKDLGG